jgi:Flp pilus assembly protein TadD
LLRRIYNEFEKNYSPARSCPGWFVFLDACDPPEITSAKVYLQQNNSQAAEEQLKLAIEKYPDNSQAYMLLGTLIYRPSKRFDEAVRCS